MLVVGDGVHVDLVVFATASPGACVGLLVTVALRPSVLVVGTGATVNGVDSTVVAVGLLLAVVRPLVRAAVYSSRLSRWRL